MAVTSRVEYTKKFNFFTALGGLIAQPFTTVEQLFLEYKKPPFVISLFLCWAITIIVPIIAQIHKYEGLAHRVPALTSFGLIMLFSVLVFIFVEGIFLLLIGIPVTLSQLAATVSFTLAPTIIMLWLTYIANYFIEGKLTFLVNFIRGYGELHPDFLAILPLIGLVLITYVLVVFFCCITTIGDLAPLSGGLITTLTFIGPLGASVAIACFLAEIALPGSLGQFKSVAKPASLGIVATVFSMTGGFLDGLLAYFRLTDV